MKTIRIAALDIANRHPLGLKCQTDSTTPDSPPNLPNCWQNRIYRDSRGRNVKELRHRADGCITRTCSRPGYVVFGSRSACTSSTAATCLSSTWTRSNIIATSLTTWTSDSSSGSLHLAHRAGIYRFARHACRGVCLRGGGRTDGP